MLGILPFVTLFFLILIADYYYKFWRKATLSAAIIWGVFLVTTTECLSWLKLLHVFPLMLCWFLFNLGIIFAYLQIRARKPVFNFYSSTQLFSKDISPFLLLLILGIVSITAIVGLIV